jgi:hypothetical protein
MSIKAIILPLALCFIASIQAVAGSNMDGTYRAEKGSIPLTAFLPMQMYLVVKGENAYFLMQGADKEERLNLKAKSEGNKLLLGSKNNKNPMKFYRRIGSNGALECFMYQAEGLPSIWIRLWCQE